MNKAEILEYNVIWLQYYASQEVQPDPMCNGFEAVNEGDVNVWVNGKLLKPFPPGHPELNGSSWGVSGNRGEIFKGIIRIVVDGTAGGQPQVAIGQKFYLNT